MNHFQELRIKHAIDARAMCAEYKVPYFKTFYFLNFGITIPAGGGSI